MIGVGWPEADVENAPADAVSPVLELTVLEIPIAAGAAESTPAPAPTSLQSAPLPLPPPAPRFPMQAAPTLATLEDHDLMERDADAERPALVAPLRLHSSADEHFFKQVKKKELLWICTTFHYIFCFDILGAEIVVDAGGVVRTTGAPLAEPRPPAPPPPLAEREAGGSGGAPGLARRRRRRRFRRRRRRRRRR